MSVEDLTDDVEVVDNAAWLAHTLSLHDEHVWLYKLLLVA